MKMLPILTPLLHIFFSLHVTQRTH